MKKPWITGDGKVFMRDGKVFFFEECPCDCEPKGLASYTTNGQDEDRKCWDLTPYQGNEMGTPGYHWRLIEVANPRTCGGVHYNSGNIDECGKLVGLPDKFCSTYSYDGYMEIQQGCPNEEGKIIWPCPNGE